MTTLSIAMLICLVAMVFAFALLAVGYHHRGEIIEGAFVFVDAVAEVAGKQIKADSMSFKKMIPHLLAGERVKRKDWKGYWTWEDNNILMHCKDGSTLKLNGEMEDVLYTLKSITTDDWEVVPESYKIPTTNKKTKK